MNNFDPETGLHWYRKIDSPPDIAEKAVRFSRLMSSELGIGVPVLNWFEKADLKDAEPGWMSAIDKQPSSRALLTAHYQIAEVEAAQFAGSKTQLNADFLAVS